MKNGLYVDDYGHQRWFKFGKLHREDGPAVIHPDGTQVWCQLDKLHRIDGPAVTRSDGTCSYYMNDKYLTKNEWEELIMLTNLKNIL